jgi:hypothetical protein
MRRPIEVDSLIICLIRRQIAIAANLDLDTIELTGLCLSGYDLGGPIQTGSTRSCNVFRLHHPHAGEKN